MYLKTIIVWGVIGAVVAAIAIYLLSAGGVRPNAVIGGETAITDAAPVTPVPPGAPLAPGLTGTTTDQGIVVVQGTNVVSSTGAVLQANGAPVKTNVSPDSPESPRVSNPVSQSAVPSAAVKLTITAKGYSPSTFTVRAGQPVVLSLTDGDNYSHSLVFKDAVLSGVAIGVAPGETRVTSFNAPAPGTYEFYCNVFGHAARGEVGEMIVQ